jgi:hypothetical protein
MRVVCWALQIMIGILFFLFEFYDDQLLAFMVLILVWLCELFTLIRYVLHLLCMLPLVDVMYIHHLVVFHLIAVDHMLTNISL